MNRNFVFFFYLDCFHKWPFNRSTLITQSAVCKLENFERREGRYMYGEPNKFSNFNLLLFEANHPCHPRETKILVESHWSFGERSWMWSVTFDFLSPKHWWLILSMWWCNYFYKHHWHHTILVFMWSTRVLHINIFVFNFPRHWALVCLNRLLFLFSFSEQTYLFYLKFIFVN